MKARVFISYRASDGADKATALARDLDARFGSEQIFLDKEDLAAGSRWRDAITSALHDSPILIVLVTPNYLGAVDGQGKRCIERQDDPARGELEAGIAAGALVIPLLCDGVTALPDAADLPSPFDRLSELQWGRLRAFDWREDLSRLAEDLRRAGVTPATATPDESPTQPITTPMPLAESAPISRSGEANAPVDRRLVIGAGALALLGLGSWSFWLWRRRRRADLSGRWSARIGARGAQSSRDSELVIVMLEQAGRKLTLASSAVNIERDPDWQNYRDFWQQRTGTELHRVLYRGEGKVLGDDEDEDDDVDASDETASAASRASPSPKLVIARRIVVTIHIFAPGSESEPIDGGVLRGTVDLDDQHIHGRLWLDSEQAERVVDVKRGG